MGERSEDGLSAVKRRLLAQLLEESEARGGQHALPAESLVVLLRSGPARPPLFLIHPITGVAFPYYELASLLAIGRPIYGVQSFDRRGAVQPGWRMRSIAGHYLAELRRVQPRGPYYLGGWSFGSMAAYEMASQLTRAGEEVRLLLLLDTWAPGAGGAGDALRFGLSLVRDVWPYVHDYGELRWGRPSAGRSRATRIGTALSHQGMHAVRPPGLWALLRSFLINSLAVLTYRPQPYPGRIHLIRTVATPSAVLEQPSWGWDRLAAGGVDVRTTVGNHMDLMKAPVVQAIAAAVEASFAAAEAPAGASA
jgi:thioesterase domain-containing protein